MPTLQDPRPKEKSYDTRKLHALLLRSNEWATMPVGISVAPSAVRQTLDWQAAAIHEVGDGFREIAARLPSGSLTPLERQAAGRAPLPAQEPWVISTNSLIREHPAARAFAGPAGERLADLTARDTILRMIETWAGRTKDEALDTRLLIGALGWYLITSVVGVLRERVEAETDPQARDALINDFGPMLVILGEIEQKQRDNLKSQAGRRGEMQAELDEADGELKLAQDRHAWKTGQPLSQEDLLNLARNQGTTPRPPAGAPQQAPAKRSRRTRR